MAEWSIWMLEYAHHDTHPVSRVTYGAGYGETAYFPFSYTLLEGEGHLALVDVGFDDRSAFVNQILHESPIVGCASPEHVLAKVGVRPDDIDTIFITHAHFDHMGNLQAFPNAHVYVQARELERWEYALSLPPKFSALTEVLDPADVLYARQLQDDGRLTLVEGTATDVLPGIDLKPAFDSHTDGSQYVVIRNSTDTWVVTGDNASSYENVETSEKRPSYLGIGYGTGSLWRSLFLIDEMLQTAGASSRLVIGHAAGTYERFPSLRSSDGLGVAEMRLAPGATTRLQGVTRG